MSVFASLAVFILVFAGAAIALHKYFLKNQQPQVAREVAETAPQAHTAPGSWTVLDNSAPSPAPSPPVKSNSPFQRITDRGSARSVARQGVWAAFFCAATSALLIILTRSGMQLEPPINATTALDIAAYGGLGFGMLRMSRLAAAGALAFYLAERLILKAPTPLSWPIIIAVSFCFVNSIRATVAYHRLP